MLISSFDSLPERMKCDQVKHYYNILFQKRNYLALKRFFDIVVSAVLIILLLIPMAIIAALIKLDSKGPVFFTQTRVTSGMDLFKIIKFRTMVNDAQSKGPQITVDGDDRITRIGRKLREYRLDELPQLFNVFVGDMTFVGTRPEVTKYVDAYTDDMLATLLLPAGVTSETSIIFKDEAKLLENVDDADKEYVCNILPQKMKYNLEYLKSISLKGDIAILYKTLFAVGKGENNG